VSGSTFIVTGASVGVDNASPSYALDVNGQERVTGQQIIGGTLTVQGAATIGGNLSISGSTLTVGGSIVGGLFYSSGGGTFIPSITMYFPGWSLGYNPRTVYADLSLYPLTGSITTCTVTLGNNGGAAFTSLQSVVTSSRTSFTTLPGASTFQLSVASMSATSGPGIFHFMHKPQAGLLGSTLSWTYGRASYSGFETSDSGTGVEINTGSGTGGQEISSVRCGPRSTAFLSGTWSVYYNPW
jgi:hypothetical protein